MYPLIFLPGASGNRSFWSALQTGLSDIASSSIVVAYPGFDGVPVDTSIQSLADLQHQIGHNLDDESILIAQSMGGVLAIGLALQQPEKIKGLVLCALSGGLDFSPYACQDWRQDYSKHYPLVPHWFVSDQTQYQDLQLASLNLPILLLTGDQDPLSQVAVSQHLAQVFPHAHLEIIRGGDHFFAAIQANQVAVIIQNFLEHVHANSSVSI